MLRFGTRCLAVTAGLFFATAAAGDFLGHRISVAMDESPIVFNLFETPTPLHVEKLRILRDLTRRAIPVLGPAMAVSFGIVAVAGVHESVRRLRPYLKSRRA